MHMRQTVQKILINIITYFEEKLKQNTANPTKLWKISKQLS